MIKISKQKLICYIFLFSLLIVAIACTPNVPMVKAEAPSTQDRTLSLLNNVLDLNTQSHAISINEQSSSNQSAKINPNKSDFNLISNEGTVRVSSTFINNTLQVLYLSNYAGTLITSQPTSIIVNDARNFLTRYKNFVGDPFYGTLASSLDTVKSGTNTTETFGNVTLQVLNSNQFVGYSWTYTDENGTSALFKNVVLSYRNGQLECFLNNWPFYTIVDTPKISRDQAITLAINAAQNYSYPVSYGNTTSMVSLLGFNIMPESLKKTALSYINCPNASLARGSDPFTLYPSWYVPLGFDKFYPGDVTGINVLLWADTGDVSKISPMVADSSFGNSTLTTTQGARLNSVLLPASIMSVVSLCIGVSFNYRKRLSTILGGRKLHLLQLIGGILCAIIALGTLVTPVAATNMARIYASLDGSPNYPPGSPPQLPLEKGAMYNVATQIGLDFNAIGWNWENDIEYDTYAPDVIAQSGSDESSYAKTAVFQFGHLYDFNTAYVDNFGNPITYSSIYSQTSAGKHNFVMIWVCAQAEDRTYGMPVAWTHRDNSQYHAFMSSDGYLYPDYNGQCYIGFVGFSPLISYWGGTFEDANGNVVWTLPMAYFIEYFYGNATIGQYCVNDALDQASIGTFGTIFQFSILRTGENSWWPGEAYNPNPHLWNAGYFPSDFRQYPEFQNTPLNHMNVFGDGHIWLSPPDYITFQANDGNGGGTMIPTGIQYYNHGTYACIAAYPSQNYVFDHWYTSNPNIASISNIYSEGAFVHILGSGATIYPVFVPTPTYPTDFNYYVTYDGYSYVFYSSDTVYKPAGSNYLTFGSYFVAAYNYNDASTHYSDPDWYDLGTGTTIDVYYDLSGG